MTSLFFQGNASSQLIIPNNNDINFGLEDFTIEWYQYQIDTNTWPRIFQMGSYEDISGGISIGVSIEGGTFYFWTNSSPNSIIQLEDSDYKNKWVHFAITRSGVVLQIFMDGVNIFSTEDGTDFNSGSNLVISNESNFSDSTAFGGYILYFHWVKGLALYTENFSVSNNFPTITDNTVLLLTAYNFSGQLGNTVTNNNVITYQIAPNNFNAVPLTPPVAPIIPKNFFKPIFSDNSLVYYKPGSLPSCGVGSVRNSSVKSRRI